MTARVLTTAYGRPALDALRDVVAEAKRDDPMAAVTLLVPTNIAGVVVRRFLAHGLAADRPGVAGLYVSTLPRLAEQLASPILTGHGRRPATRPIAAAAWRAALNAKPGLFAEVAEHPATIRALTNAHGELRDLTGSALDAAAGASSLADEVVRLHRDVAQDLAERWYDTTDLLHTAAAFAAERPERLAELGVVVLWQPQALSQAEATLATALAEHADMTVITALTGVQRADRAVNRSLRRLRLDDSDPGPKPPIATEVFNASDADDEVRCTVRDVVQTLRTTPAHRVAVLYSTPTPYARLLHEHLGAAGITVNGPGVRSLHERATARCLLEVLALGPNDVPRGDLFRALAEAPTRDFSGNLVPVARWERISRSAGVVSGDDWQLRLDHYIAAERQAIADEKNREDPYQSRIERSERNIAAASALRDFATALRQRLAEGQAHTAWSQLSRWAAQMFTELLGDDTSLLRLPLEEQYAATAVKLTLDGLSTLDAVETQASYQTLRDVLELELEQALPRVGRFGDGVLVAPMTSAIGLDADTIYLAGLAEDLYPGRLHEDALLPDRVRDATNGELPSTRERLDARHRYLLAAFASGTRVVSRLPAYEGDVASRLASTDSHSVAARESLPDSSRRVGSSQRVGSRALWRRRSPRGNEATTRVPEAKAASR